MADLDTVTGDIAIWDDDRTKAVTVTTDGSKERLDVDASISSFNPTPNVSIVPVHQHLENGGSKDMAVNGSVTAVTFTAGPSTANEVWYIDEVAVYLEDPGSMTSSNFGAISGGLSTGLDFKVKISATTYTIETLQNNIDLFENFTNLNLSATAGGFFNTTDMFAGVKKWTTPVILDQANGDEFQFVVNDNLSLLTQFQISLNGWYIP